MYLELNDFAFTDEKEGFTELYIKDIRKGLLEYAKVFFEEISNDIKIPVDLMINEDLLDQVIIDTIEDLKRIVNFHPTKKPNLIKVVSYTTYWWLRRRPLIVKDSIDKLGISQENKMKLIFVNEHFLAPYIEQRIFNFDKGSEICNNKKHRAKFEEQWKYARKYMLYFLGYRADSPKSIEAFILASTLHPIRSTSDDFFRHGTADNLRD